MQYPRSCTPATLLLLAALAVPGGAQLVALSDPSMDFPAGVAAVDLDGDGDLDVLSANHDSHNLTLFFQTGLGFYDPVPVILSDPALKRPRTVAVGDLDGDGDADVISANELTDNLTIFHQTAPGVYGAVPTVIADATDMDNPKGVAIGDLDQDGDNDIVSVNALTTNVTVFFQTAPGSFAGPPTALTWGSISGRRTARVAVSDVDGDGAMDIVASNQIGNSVTVFYQTAPGVFDITVPDNPEVLIDGSMTGPANVVVADVDGDGFLDVTTANDISRNVTVFYQRVVGSFEEAQIINTLGTFKPRAVAVGDVDGDGTNDVVTANKTTDNFYVFIQVKPRVFFKDAATYPGIVTDPLLDDPIDVVAADVDGDGRADIVSANKLSDNLLVVRGKVLNYQKVVYVAGPAFVEPRDLAVADLDGDGDQEIAVADSGGPPDLFLYYQTFPLLFEAPPTSVSLSVPAQLTSLEAADLDGDGDLDLAATNALAGSAEPAVLLFQDAAGTFATESFPAAPGFSDPRELKVSDIDGDGDLDLAVSGTSGGISNAILLHYQAGPGSFSAFQPVLAPGLSAIAGLRIPDLDGDGDRDLVAAYGSGHLATFEQFVPGLFGTISLISDPALVAPTDVDVADLDGDGDQDLIADGAAPTLFFQTTPDTFGVPPVVLPLAGGCSRRIRAVDLNGNGDVEIVTLDPCDSPSSLRVYEPTGPGTYGPPDLTLNTRFFADPQYLDIADVQGNGRLDIVATALQMSSFSIFYQD